MDRIDRNIANAQVFIEIPVGRNIAAAVLHAHFDLKRTAFANGTDVDGLVENLDIGIMLNVAGGVYAWMSSLEVNRLPSLAVQFQRDLFQIENDVGGIFDYTRDR